MPLAQEFKVTSQEQWARSDQYHNSFLLPEDEILDAALKNSTANGLPEIAVSAAQGKFLNLLASSIGAKKILEVGTLGGYCYILSLPSRVLMTEDIPRSGLRARYPLTESSRHSRWRRNTQRQVVSTVLDVYT